MVIHLVPGSFYRKSIGGKFPYVGFTVFHLELNSLLGVPNCMILYESSVVSERYCVDYE